MNKKRVLIITYYWPPAGGPGVQRVLKFAKYLPQFGWEPIILTVKKGNYPATDYSLNQEVAPDLQVIKCRHFEPNRIYQKILANNEKKIPVAVLAQKEKNWKDKLTHWIRLNLFVPDAKIFWQKPALKEAEKLMKQMKIDLLFSSSPPPTAHLIALKLKKKFNLKWIADFRDPWTKIHYYRNLNRTSFARNRDQFLEKKVVQNCDGIITASKLFRQLLPLTIEQPSRVITNGYDDEVKIIKPVKQEDFALVHMGGITANRFYPEFFSGIKKLLLNPEIKRKLRLILIGNVNPEIVKKITTFIPPKNLEITGYLDHHQALAIMKGAALNLIFLEKLPNYQGHIPAKIFEYIAVKRPIIGAGDPHGDTAKIIKKSGCGNIYPATSEWKDLINVCYKKWISGYSPEINPEYISRFHRRTLTQKLAEYFEEVL